MSEKTYEQDFIDEVISFFEEGHPKSVVCKNYYISRQTLNSFLQDHYGFYSLENLEGLSPEQIEAVNELKAKREENYKRFVETANYYILEMRKAHQKQLAGEEYVPEEVPAEIKAKFDELNTPRPHFTRIALERAMEPKKPKAAPKQRITYSRKKK